MIHYVNCISIFFIMPYLPFSLETQSLCFICLLETLSLDASSEALLSVWTKTNDQSFLWPMLGRHVVSKGNRTQLVPWGTWQTMPFLKTHRHIPQLFAELFIYFFLGYLKINPFCAPPESGCTLQIASCCSARRQSARSVCFHPAFSSHSSVRPPWPAGGAG